VVIIKKYLAPILATGLLTLSGIAFAQIPETQHSNGVAYISGGVGEDEALAMVVESKQWPLMLELSQLENGRGVWIFGAQIKITNDQKKVIFDAISEGPYILINLEPGTYSIEATYQGVVQKQSVAVKVGQNQKLSIFWK
jgi:hypothetical protein